MRLTETVATGGRRAPSRVVFGPHVTNLGSGRAFSRRHTAYYERRAAGGAGVLVTETASVHADDWPYERAPLAAECEPGWREIAAACEPYGTVVLAGLGHAGGQGSSAYSQSVLWAPSRFPDANTRELPAEMEQPQIDEVVAGFADAAAAAVRAGLAGVELDAGAFSLLRQFQSGLSNLRGDEYGTDKLRFTREVIAAVRERLGAEHVLTLRMCCDELAPWAGITPDHAAEHVDALADLVDLLVVVRGGPYSTSAYRPDAHTLPAFNRELCRQLRATADGRTQVVLQGSVVDAADAEAAVVDGVADLVEMTRAQIAEPRLVALLRDGRGAQARPCVLCNQACQVRDARNPIVSCIGEPGSGHETEERAIDAAARDVLVVGGGPAGLECARVAASSGHRVRLVERAPRLGGALRAAAVGPGRTRLALLTDWLAAECRRLGVGVRLDTEATAETLDEAAASGTAVVLATGSRPRVSDGTDALGVLERGAETLPDGPVVVHDPVGGPVGVGVAEWLAEAGREVAIVTGDPVVGTLLSLTGDLPDANTRLQRAGVRRELRARVVERVVDGVVVEDVWTGERRTVPGAVFVDCGPRLPEETLYLARPGTTRAGDCVAPRTALEAVLEGRRCAARISDERELVGGIH
ncbi:MAG: mycofactocin system FadH/OYE family oxidoreductase 1 [Streptosporangiales bacterium]|nr:mycofactocin system FadH/OYE family oxidoreductase 1 [Streptosporangiales bacterium]